MIELATYEALAKEILRRILAEQSAEEIHQWLESAISRLGGGDESAILTWPQSFTLMREIIDHYEVMASKPESERKTLTWPWQSWRNLMDPLEAGMLGLITAPDGQGKTIYAETIAEHWAAHKNKIVFVHYELNRRLMMMRRTARHASVSVRAMKEGKLTSAEKRKIYDLEPSLLAWDGYITYLHTPGWSMERTVAELRRLHAEGECDAVVLDYLEKASASARQLKMFGSNIYQREADNVEQLKNFAEQTETPVLMVAQMNKDGKQTGFGTVDRTSIRGAGEKTDKSNLVVLLKRERLEGDGYSNEVKVLVDKNTMGATGTITQMMQPEYFRVGDLYNG